MEQQLKQRLIGVTIVVALVVIFVPMLFDQNGDRGAGTPDGIPPIPEEVVEKKSVELPRTAEDMAPKDAETTPESGYKIVPLTDDTPSAGKRKEKEGASPLAADAEPMGESEEGPVDEDEMPASEEAAADEAPTTPAPKAARGDRQSAPEPIKSRALTPAAPKKVETPPAKVTKAAPARPAAPDASKKPAKPAAAETLAPKTATAPQQAPKTQDAAAPRTASEASSVPSAWAVQTGSFTTEAKAVALTEKLRQSKYPAFVERVQGDSGMIYRVKVGPELERGRAEQVQKQIEGNVGIKGIVVPQR